MKTSGIIFSIAALASILTGCSTGMYRETRVMMGTFVEVTAPDKNAARIAFDEIKRIEQLLSKYDPKSEISMLNSTGTIKASPETLYIMKRSAEFWHLSGGAFDPTVGPLLDIWGFTDRNFRVPPPEEIQKTLQAVGMDKVLIDEAGSTIQFKEPGMRIDLGAIAKGYAVDCAVTKLRAAGIKNCLINAGGDIYCLGTKSGSPWKVAIKNPYEREQKYLDLENKAVATSGNYEQFFIKNDKRYSHIFDPKTGSPVETRIFSVTVVAPDCLTADALATATFVLGNEKSWEMSKQFTEVRVMIFEMEADQQ
jgi:thiamine biosynthesis lipoprotein